MFYLWWEWSRIDDLFDNIGMLVGAMIHSEKSLVLRVILCPIIFDDQRRERWWKVPEDVCILRCIGYVCR